MLLSNIFFHKAINIILGSKRMKANLFHVDFVAALVGLFESLCLFQCSEIDIGET